MHIWPFALSLLKNKHLDSYGSDKKKKKAALQKMIMKESLVDVWANRTPEKQRALMQLFHQFEITALSAFMSLCP